jgi:hypothetical protein
MTKALAFLFTLLAATPLSAQSFTVQWDPSPSPDAVGYIVHIGSAPGSYEFTRDVGSSLTFTYSAPVYGTYYVALASYNAGAVKGPLSSVVSTTITQPVPQPPLQPSPDGTLATSLVDCSPATWSLSSTGQTLRNGQVVNGAGSIYKLVSCVVWVKGTDALWYRWENGAWVYTGQAQEPGTVQPAPVPDTAPPTFTMTVGRRTGNNYPITLNNVTDNIEVDRAEIYVDNKPTPDVILPSAMLISGTRWEAKVMLKSPGQHVITAKVFDASGNVGSHSVAVVR